MPSKDLVQTVTAVTWKQRSFELWLHCQTISSDLFFNVPLTSKNVHSVNAEQMKGKVPLKLPHCGLEAVKISAQLPYHREPYSLLHSPSQENHFSGLMWYSVMAHMLLQKFYCFWLRYYEIHSKPFRLRIYWWQGRKYWKNASKVTISTLSMICSVRRYFPEPHFTIFCIAKSNHVGRCREALKHE